MDHTRSIDNIIEFLNSPNLTDSGKSRELYNAFFKLNQDACLRFTECEQLWRNNEKYAALSLAKRPPELFPLLEKLMFPQRDLLCQVAYLYDWKTLDAVSQDKISMMKEILFNTNLLIDEYKQISGSGDLKSEIALLKSIADMHPEDTKWLLTLYAVEEKYVDELIFKAETAINNCDYSLFFKLHDELLDISKNTPVPVKEMSKLSRNITNFPAAEIEKYNEFIFLKLKKAYQQHDVNAVENRLVLWQGFCKNNNLVLNGEQQKLYNQAEAFLSHEKNHDSGTGFLSLVDEYSSGTGGSQRIDSGNFQQIKDDKPQFHGKAVMRIAYFLITAVAVVFYVYFISNALKKQKMLDSLQVANINETKRIYSEISANYPELLNKPEAKKAEADLKDEQNRKEFFANSIKKIEKSRSDWGVNRIYVQTAINDLFKMSHTNEDREKVKRLQQSFHETVNEYTHKAKLDFDNKISELVSLMTSIDTYIINKEFKDAERELKSLRHCVEQIKKTRYAGIRPAVLEEHKGILKSAEILENRLNKSKSDEKQYADILADFQANILKTADFEHFASKVEKMSVLSKDRSFDMYTVCNELMNEINAYRRLQKIQNTSDIRKISDQAIQSGLFLDRLKFNSIAAARKSAKDKTIEVFERLHEQNKRKPLCFVRLKDDSTDKYIDLYVHKNSVQKEKNAMVMISDTNQRIKISRRGIHFYDYDLEIGTGVRKKCTLVFPNQMTTGKIRSSAARYQLLTEIIFEDLKNSEYDEFCGKVINNLKMVMEDTLCSHDKKVELSTELLKQIVSLVPDPGGVVRKQYEALMQQQKDSGRAKMKKIDYATLQEHFSKQFDLWQTAANSSYEFFGVIFLNKERILPEMQKNKTKRYVLCFDESGNKFMIYGTYDGTKISHSRRFADDPGTKLLFIAKKNIDYGTLYRDLTKHADKVVLPHTWPVNYPEGAQ